MIPKRSGVRIKNDRRDALTLARLYRAEELTGIYLPDPEDEAVRDLAHARNDAGLAERKAKQQISQVGSQNKKRWSLEDSTLNNNL